MLKDAFRSVFSKSEQSARAEEARPTNEGVQNFVLDDLQNSGSAASGGFDYFAGWDGDKFAGGFGCTTEFVVDYWTLRQRSTELFTKNLYARGIIRRFVTNVISTGIELEAQPDELLIDYEGNLDDWSEEVESYFNAWASQPRLCDVKKQKTFGKIQAEAYRAAIVSGDVLVMLDVDNNVNLPKVKLVSGNKVTDPVLSDTSPAKDANIQHGVQIGKNGEHVGYWVLQEDGTHKFVRAYGQKSGRRVAWLVYGSDRLIDEVRGQPLLSLVLQSLKEIDRYRDSAQRKALVNSFIAMFVKREKDNMPSNLLSRTSLQTDEIDASGVEGSRDFNVLKMMPGMAIDELNAGETIEHVGGQGTDLNFPEFESTIVSAIAWCLETPPEILLMSFNKNYSASQAALHEYRMTLNTKRSEWGVEFCQPIYEQFLILQALSSKISAPGFVDAWSDPLAWDIYAGWVRADWFGTIKPSADILKTVKAYQALIDGGFITYAQATRELTGKKWRVVINTLKKERELFLEVFGAAEGGIQPNQGTPGQSATLLKLVQNFKDDIVDAVADQIEEQG